VDSTERVEGAKAQDEALAHQVVQAAVDLAQNVRLAYVQVAADRARIEVLTQIATLKSERRRLPMLRVDVGDTSPLTIDEAYQDELDAVTGYSVAPSMNSVRGPASPR
jgi:outer membrane protein TolC